jgi:hypothetical protein
LNAPEPQRATPGGRQAGDAALDRRGVGAVDIRDRDAVAAVAGGGALIPSLRYRPGARQMRYLLLPRLHY